MHDEPLVYRSFLEEVLRGRRTEPEAGAGRYLDEKLKQLDFPLCGFTRACNIGCVRQIAVVLIKMEEREGEGDRIFFIRHKASSFFSPGRRKKRKKERDKFEN